MLLNIFKLLVWLLMVIVVLTFNITVLVLAQPFIFARNQKGIDCAKKLICWFTDMMKPVENWTEVRY